VGAAPLPSSPLLQCHPHVAPSLHHLPTSLTQPQGQEKMSKSDPNSAIFMEDSEGDVNTKIKKAFCPPQVSALGVCCVVFVVLWVCIVWPVRPQTPLRAVNHGQPRLGSPGICHTLRKRSAFTPPHACCRWLRATPAMSTPPTSCSPGLASWRCVRPGAALRRENSSGLVSVTQQAE
jgi:hypothetical protein